MQAIIKKYSAVLKINWIQALEYRANAVVGVVAILSGLFIEYQIWSLIFESQDLTSVNGFEFRELMIFIFLSIIFLILDAMTSPLVLIPIIATLSKSALPSMISCDNLVIILLIEL